MDQKPSILQGLSPAQMFIGGIVTGVLVLCTIGFFILLGIMFKGESSFSFGGGGNDSGGGEIADATGSGSNGGIAGGMLGLAKEAGVKDIKQFESCWKDKKYAAKVQEQQDEAQAAGLQGTPYSVMVGPNNQKYAINGAYPIQVLEWVVQKMQGKNPAVPAGMKVEDLPKLDSTLVTKPVDYDKDDVRGPKNGKITLIEYSDLECPFCKRFHETMKQLLAKYPNDVRWVYRHSPIDQLHSKARSEAAAVECAREQGKFWELTDLIFKVTPGNDGLVL